MFALPRETGGNRRGFMGAFHSPEQQPAAHKKGGVAAESPRNRAAIILNAGAGKHAQRFRADRPFFAATAGDMRPKFRASNSRQNVRV